MFSELKNIFQNISATDSLHIFLDLVVANKLLSEHSILNGDYQSYRTSMTNISYLFYNRVTSLILHAFFKYVIPLHKKICTKINL